MQVQRAFWRIWQVLGDDYQPFIIDKFMFLVGSGRFKMVAPMYICRSTFALFEKKRAEVLAAKVCVPGQRTENGVPTR